MKTEFETLAEKHGLCLFTTKEGIYRYIETSIAKIFWDAQQVKIDKLEHDLGNEQCANRMLQHVLDKEVKS